MHGHHPALAVTPAEAATFPVEEGAFYGDVFTPEGEPIIAYACRGHAQAAGEAGSLGAGPAARA